MNKKFDVINRRTTAKSNVRKMTGTLGLGKSFAVTRKQWRQAGYSSKTRIASVVAVTSRELPDSPRYGKKFKTAIYKNGWLVTRTK